MEFHGAFLSAQLSEFDGNFPVREKATCGAFCINPASVIHAMILGRNPDSNCLKNMDILS